MYKLWCYFIYGFVPKWEIIAKTDVYGDHDRHLENRIPISRIYVLQCEQTGNIKRKIIDDKTWF